MCAVAQRGQKRVSDFLELQLKGNVRLWCWKPNSGPLEGQYKF